MRASSSLPASVSPLISWISRGVPCGLTWGPCEPPSRQSPRYGAGGCRAGRKGVTGEIPTPFWFCPPECRGWEPPPLGAPFPGLTPPVPSPSTQVLERPLEEGGCDPEEPERRWVQGHPVPSQLLVEGSREPPHTHSGCGPRPGDPSWGHPALIPSWAFLCRALQGARGCPELEMQEL